MSMVCPFWISEIENSGRNTDTSQKNDRHAGHVRAPVCTAGQDLLFCSPEPLLLQGGFTFFCDPGCEGKDSLNGGAVLLFF